MGIAIEIGVEVDNCELWWQRFRKSEWRKVQINSERVEKYRKLFQKREHAYRLQFLKAETRYNAGFTELWLREWRCLDYFRNGWKCPGRNLVKKKAKVVLKRWN